MNIINNNPMVISSSSASSATASSAIASNVKVKEITDYLVSFAENNSSIYFNTHSNLRSQLQQQMALEIYSRESALRLVADQYLPIIIKEFNVNTKDENRARLYNVKKEFQDLNVNQLNQKRLSIPTMAGKLPANVRELICTRLLDWLVSDVNQLLSEQRQYENMIIKRHENSWKYRRRRKGT